MSDRRPYWLTELEWDRVTTLLMVEGTVGLGPASDGSPNIDEDLFGSLMDQHDNDPEVRMEFGREFVSPAPGDVVVPWNTEFHGEPDLTKLPPSAARGHAMRWVTRTIAFGKWQLVEPTGQ